jgi:pyruvate dehydrogenase E2 component (dihydrolipoamide acetyltransferase)
MAEGTLLSWKKAVGDPIAAGDVLAEIETDKATMEWEAQEDGVLAQILVPEGSSGVSVGSPVFVQVESAEDVAAFASFTVADAGVAEDAKVDIPEMAPSMGANVETAVKAPVTAAASPPSTTSGDKRPAASPGSRVIASPYARKLAAANNVSLHALQGSGPNGRIVAADVLGAPAGSAAGTPGFVDIANSNIRKIIAQRLLESKQQIPHYYLSTTCRVDTVSALRAKLNASLSDGKLSMNDFIIKASAMALKKVPEANASWHGDFIRQYNTVNCSIAVQTPAGLMVPVVRSAEKKGLAAISANVKELASKAREGRLDPSESAEGTFTISNLGMFGVSQFAAIVNPPQACILAVGAAEKKVVPSTMEPGTFEEGTFVTVTLSCDHRVIDGAVGAQWLQAFKGYLEDPASMLL